MPTLASALSLGVPGGWLVGIILGLALGALAGYGVWRLRREPKPRRRRALTALRIGTAALAWVVAVQPTWRTPRYSESEGQLAVLVDRSRSMSLAGDGEPRRARAEALLERWRDEAGRTALVYTFGEQLAPADLSRLADGVDASAEESRLGAALARLLEEEPELGAVVVLGDGADRSGFAFDGLETDGVRVHAVATSEDSLRDDAIAEVSADSVGFLRRSARVRVVVRSLGGSGGPVPVTLYRGDEVEREVVVEVPADGEAEVDIQFTPRELGRAVYRVSIPRALDDAVPENNERAFLVRVTRDKLRVLLVAGQPSWDQRFLRAFLKRDPATDLISFFILRNTTDMTMAGADELALIPFPTDELFNEHLGSFDLVIFQNFEYGPYQMASYLPRIRDYVMRGGSFAMIGGPLSFHSGGYADTPISEILPVDLPPASAPPSRTVALGEFAPRIAEGMEHHPLLALVPDPARNLTAWGRLADLRGINVVQGVRPGAAVLLEHPEVRLAEGSPHPVLVLGSAGEGRTLALTTDTTWRWGVTTGGQTGDASAYERFWDRAIRWLSRDPTLEPARVTTDRERYGPGAQMEVEATLRDERYAPYRETNVALVLEDAAGAELARREVQTDREGGARASFELPSRPGAYRIRARLGSRDRALAEEWLVVEAGGDELADPRADVGLLRTLASRTEGRFVARPEDAPELSAFDTTRRRALGTAELAPLAGPLGFALLLGLFFAEWLLRRRWGHR